MFKVGDEVRVTSYYCFRELEGHVGTIIKIYDDDPWPYDVRFADGNEYVFNDKEIELIS
jgi:hypothetical protein